MTFELDKTYYCTECKRNHRTATQLGVDHIAFDEEYVITKSEWKNMSKVEITEHLKDISIRKKLAEKMKLEAEKERVRQKEVKQRQEKSSGIKAKYSEIVMNKMISTKVKYSLTKYSTVRTVAGAYPLVPENEIYNIDCIDTEFISNLSKDNPILKANGKRAPGHYILVKKKHKSFGKTEHSIYIYFHGIIKR